MNSFKAIIFFALFVIANCLVSDLINEVLKDKCNHEASFLNPINVESCRTAGDRGEGDLLCQGIAPTLNDICSNSSTITLEQVMNLVKLNDSLQDFCKKVDSIKISSIILPKNVSENLNKMNGSKCSCFCMWENRLNPICSFLFAYAELKNSNNSKGAISNAALEKDVPIKKDNISKSNPLAEVEEHIREDKPSDDNAPSVSSKLDEETYTAEKTPPENPREAINPTDKGPKPELEPENAEKDDDNEKNEKIGNKYPRISSSVTESGSLFTYFVFISVLCMLFYLAMYNKKKILALLIEGRRSNVKRRPNSAAYSKLDCTLEEAMASGPSTSSSNTLLY